MTRWQLPDGIEELLPEQAARVERVRRQLLDLFGSWGYEFVIPPMLEFTESLLVGFGEDLDLQTFKVIDQMSGRMLGIRADITPQTARMDAHSLGGEGLRRLCYAGSVVHTHPASLKASRAPIQLGAELYGEASVAADIEVISLMLSSLQSLGIDELTLDLGHVGIYRSLLDSVSLSTEQEDSLFELLQRKNHSELDAALSELFESVIDREAFSCLARLNGGADVLDQANELPANPALKAALEDLSCVRAAINARFPSVNLYFDLSELRGYKYHTGLVFAAYVPGVGRALANGGRYDDIGQAYGCARPATGFNADLKSLLALEVPQGSEPNAPISAPNNNDPALWAAIAELRAQGESVITEFSDAPTSGRRLVCDASGQWAVAEQ